MNTFATSRGSPLPRKAEQERVVRDMLHDAAVARCGRCNENLLNWWDFCPHCGAAVIWDEQQQPDNPPAIR